MSTTGSTPVELLLIEDDPHAASLVIERVKHFAPGEFKVSQARSLQSGLDEAADYSFNIAALDLTLPDSTGIETCSRFSAAQPEVPFVVLTGVADASLTDTLSKAGARAVLFKDDYKALDLINALRYAAASNRIHGPRQTRAVNEARFRNAIVDSADGIVVIDSAGTILLVSAGAESLLGRPAADLTGSPLGIDLQIGKPVRAQMVTEKPGHAAVHAPDGPVRQFDVCEMKISEVEFWPFAHHWSGSPVTVCAMRDISNQSAEELRQRNLSRIDQPLQVSAGIESVCADLAVRLGALVRFNRFEAALWRPDLERLQVMAELGEQVPGRAVSSLVSRGEPASGFGSWITEWSAEENSPRVAISIGSISPDAYSARDAAVLARCASIVAASLAKMKSSPVFGPSTQLPGDLDAPWPDRPSTLPEAA